MSTKPKHDIAWSDGADPHLPSMLKGLPRVYGEDWSVYEDGQTGYVRTRNLKPFERRKARDVVALHTHSANWVQSAMIRAALVMDASPESLYIFGVGALAVAASFYYRE